MATSIFDNEIVLLVQDPVLPGSIKSQSIKQSLSPQNSECNLKPDSKTVGLQAVGWNKQSEDKVSSNEEITGIT